MTPQGGGTGPWHSPSRPQALGARLDQPFLENQGDPKERRVWSEGGSQPINPALSPLILMGLIWGCSLHLIPLVGPPHPHPWSCGDTGTHNPKFPVGFTHRWSREARLALETLWRKKELRKTPQTHPTARPHSQTRPRAGPAGPVPLLGTLTWSPFSPALPGRPRSPLGPCGEMGL